MSSNPSVEDTVDVVSQLLNRRIGLRSEPALRGRLERCIRDDAAGGLDVDGYVDALLHGGTALQSLVNRVTVQETAFFRHPEHFELLANEILPTLDPPLTIWSAACSNGQEAYSLAMLLEELGIQGSIMATDLSTTAIARTLDARYTDREIAGLSPQRIARHLVRQGDKYQVKSNLRARVTAMRYNLLDPIPSQVARSQVVFCRNVLIYFSPVHARAFLGRVARALPHAAVFLGAAETIWQLSDEYQTVRTGDTFFYCRSPGSTPVDDHHAPAPKRPPEPFLAATIGPLRGPRGDNAAGLIGRPGLAGAVAPPSPTKAPRTRSPDNRDDVSLSVSLGLAGQRATAAGDFATAVVAFRKCAYLAPHDPMAHLNLGLALETAGDLASAQRAYAAARDALKNSHRDRIEQAIEGYTTEDLMRFIHHKQQAVNP